MRSVAQCVNDLNWHERGACILNQVNTLTDDELELCVVWCENHAARSKALLRELTRDLSPLWSSRIRRLGSRIYVSPRWKGLHAADGGPDRSLGLHYATFVALAATVPFPAGSDPDGRDPNCQASESERLFASAMSLIGQCRISEDRCAFITALVVDWEDTADVLIDAAGRLCP